MSNIVVVVKGIHKKLLRSVSRQREDGKTQRCGTALRSAFSSSACHHVDLRLKFVFLPNCTQMLQQKEGCVQIFICYCSGQCVMCA